MTSFKFFYIVEQFILSFFKRHLMI